MSLSLRLTDVIGRIGLEFKSVRSAIAQKYTKPTPGIPIEDLSSNAVADLRDASKLTGALTSGVNSSASVVVSYHDAFGGTFQYSLSELAIILADTTHSVDQKIQLVDSFPTNYTPGVLYVTEE